VAVGLLHEKEHQIRQRKDAQDAIAASQRGRFGDGQMPLPTA